MQFGQIDNQLSTCKTHLDATGMWATEIEYFLVQFLLVRICAEWEPRIQEMFELRCTRTTDTHLRRFAISSAKYFSNRFSIKDIGRMLSRFGDDYHKLFNSTIVATKAYLAWDSLYSNRVAVAHRAGTQMSFVELTTAYQDCLPVLDALAASLGLTADEIKHFV